MQETYQKDNLEILKIQLNINDFSDLLTQPVNASILFTYLILCPPPSHDQIQIQDYHVRDVLSEHKRPSGFTLSYFGLRGPATKEVILVAKSLSRGI